MRCRQISKRLSICLTDRGVVAEAFEGVAREDILGRFREAAVKVWGEDSVKRLNILLGDEEPEGDHLAALKYAGTPWAIGDSLVRYSTKYTLLVAPALLDQDDATIDKILIHEAVHIGYRGHGQDFRRLVRQHGGAVSASAAEAGYKIAVQRKEGSRYKTIREFDAGAEIEATAWAKAELVRNPGRYRVLM